MAQYALDRVLSVAGSDVSTGNVIFLADQVVDPSLSFTSETEDVVDALNNVVMVLENGRGCTFSASNAFFNTQILAAQVGGEVTGSSEATKRELLVFEDTGIHAKLSSIPVNGNVKVYELSKDSSIPDRDVSSLVEYRDSENWIDFKSPEAEYDPSATYVAVYTAKNVVTQTITKYEVVTLNKRYDIAPLSFMMKNMSTTKVYKLSDDGSIITATSITDIGTADGTEIYLTNEDDFEPGKYLVVYEADVPVDEQITAYADAKNRLMNITAEVLLRDLCKEELYYAYIIMRGKLSGEAEWSMTRDGNHPFEIRCFPEYCGDKKLVDVIIVKGNE